MLCVELCYLKNKEYYDVIILSGRDQIHDRFDQALTEIITS